MSFTQGTQRSFAMGVILHTSEELAALDTLEEIVIHQFKVAFSSEVSSNL